MRFAVETVVSVKSFGVIVGGRILDRGHPMAGHRMRLRATSIAILGQPVPGETWDVEGDVVDTAWGLQVVATRAVRSLPTGKLLCAYLAANVPGIGPERAQALWNRFGSDVGRVLADPRQLGLVAAIIAPDRPTLGPRLAASCQSAWQEAKAEADVIAWLSERGVDEMRVARTIMQAYGGKAVVQLGDNPYCLVPLLPWAMVDRVGLALLSEAGIADPSKDRRRLVGAADAVVKQVLREAGTAIGDAAFRERLARTLSIHSRAAIDEAVEAAAANQAIIPGANGTWRAPGAATMEEHLCQRLGRMLASDYPSREDEGGPGTLAAFVGSRTVKGAALHPEQQDAVLRVLAKPLAVLNGGAGVGKTAVVRAVADAWERCFGGKVVLCALAGKAALRLSQATGRLAMTIARLAHQLQEREQIAQQFTMGELSHGERDGKRARLDHLAELTPETLLVVDEASMVDLASLHRLVRQMPEGARLLLVGDEGQLPPVSFGIVFHRLVTDAAITTRLTVVHRQSESGGIPLVAGILRQGHVPVLPNHSGPGEGVSMRRCERTALAQAVEAVWDGLGGLGAGTLIVSTTWDGDAGVRALNERLQSRRAPGSTETVKGHLGQWFSVGDPVMFLRNDYGRGLFNRMMGVVVRVSCEVRTVSVRFDGMEAANEFQADELVDLALAYAMTVHSSQGSQAPAVIIPLYPNRLLDPSLLYTAVTRAERQVVFVGTDAVLEAAMARLPAAVTRLVGFEWPGTPMSIESRLDAAHVADTDIEPCA